MNDFDVGTKVLKSFYKYAGLKLTYEQMLERIQPNPIKRKIEIEGVGMGVNNVNDDVVFLSDSKIDTAMKNLAKKSSGKIPSGIQIFFKYLQNEATNVTLIDALPYVVEESGKNLLSGAQALGDSLLTTGRILNFLLPLIIIVGLFLYANQKSNGSIVKGLKSLK